MRHILTILSFLVAIFTFGQSLSNKYLHYKTDYYWDTTLYRSERVYYYEVANGKITQKEYPVLRYMFTRILNDTPLVTKDTFERLDWSGYPYKYVRKGNNIYLQYFDVGKRKLQLNKEYSLAHRDTVSWLVDKNSLDSKDGVSISGFSIYLGDTVIEINGRQFKTFHFLEYHNQLSSHPNYYTEEVYLDQRALIPIRSVTVHYNFKTQEKHLYSSVTILASSSNTLADYTNKTNKDLVLYENKNTIWTEQQKQVFLGMFSLDMKQYAECILKKLDGYISFFHFEQNIYFKRLLAGKECE